MISKNSFLVRLLIFSLIVAAIFFLAESYFPEKVKYYNFWIIQLLMIIITIYFHYGLIKAAEKGNQPFIRFFMGATGVKLFLLMTVMIGYGLFNKETAFGFIIHLFLFYILYTIFEVTLIYKKFSSLRK
jgi:hypothetical protein